MYQTGNRVVYGIHGVCTVAAMESRVIDGKTVQYLVLEPIGKEDARYLVPTYNGAAMKKVRAILTKEELDHLIHSDVIRADTWIRDENARKQRYRELIGGGDRVGLMSMVRSIYRHKTEKEAAGKRCHLCDENFLRDAEKLLSGEIAIVMEMEFDQARAYLRQQLKA